VALAANAAAYRRAVQAGAPGDCWTTHPHRRQRKAGPGYRQELALRERAVGPSGAFFPRSSDAGRPDPPGRRAGSGGATLAAVACRAPVFAQPPDLNRLRILRSTAGRQPAPAGLLAAGQDLRPATAARPDGHIGHAVRSPVHHPCRPPRAARPRHAGSGGRCVSPFDHRDVSAPPEGVTAPVHARRSRAGVRPRVFVTDRHGRVTRTLQKVSVQAMDAAGATDSAGQVLIDTGPAVLDAPSAQAMATLAGVPAEPRRKSRRSPGPLRRPG